MANLYPVGAQPLTVAAGSPGFVIDGILLSLSDVLPGDRLCTSTADAPILVVDDDNGHQLAHGWEGPTITSSTSWWIRRESDLRYSGLFMAQQSSRIASHFAQALALGLPYKVLAETNTPPSDPEEEDRYLIGTSPTGAWASNAKSIATWFNGGWVFAAPTIGATATNVTSSVMKVFDGSTWNAASSADITDPELLALAGLTSAADKGLHFTGAGTAATHDLTAAGRALLGDADAAAQRATLGAVGTTGAQSIEGPLGVGVGSAMTRIDILGAIARDAQIKVRSEATGSAIGGGILLHHNNAGETFPVTGDRLGYVLFGTTIGSSQYQGAGLVARAEGDYSGTSTPTYFAFETAPTGSTTRAVRLVIDKDGHTSPGTDNAYTLGKSGARFSAVWAATGTIQTSDARDKTVVGDLGFAGALVDAVEPVLFRWNVGGFEVMPSETETEIDDDGVERPKLVPVPRPGARIHAGFLAQDILAAMQAAAVDFGAWGREDKDDTDSRQWTRPDQLIPVLWAALKEARADFAALKARVDAIEGA